MEINEKLYSGTLGIIGSLTLVTILLLTFLGCTARPTDLRVGVPPSLAEQANPKANAEAVQRTAKNVLDSTVRLVLQGADGRSLEVGSGFFVRPGLVVTNLYVVEGADTGYAKLVGKNTRYPIKNIDRNEEHGLALLKVTVPGVKSLWLGDSDTIQYGTPVYAVGNPPESRDMFSKGIATYHSFDNNVINIEEGGIVVLEDRTIRGPYLYVGNIEWLGLTIQISRRGSGCPVLNDKGEVIGVSSHRGSTSGRVGSFAITSKTIKSLLDLNRQ